MVFDNGKVTYAENEKSPSDVDVSSPPWEKMVEVLTSA
jgi:hypothetical protein